MQQLRTGRQMVPAGWLLCLQCLDIWGLADPGGRALPGAGQLPEPVRGLRVSGLGIKTNAPRAYALDTPWPYIALPT